MFSRANKELNGPHIFEGATCALWGIWKQKNSNFFENTQPSFQAWRVVFKKDVSLIIHRVKPKHKEALS
jgi:hypothetical protein